MTGSWRHMPAEFKLQAHSPTLQLWLLCPPKISILAGPDFPGPILGMMKPRQSNFPLKIHSLKCLN